MLPNIHYKRELSEGYQIASGQIQRNTMDTMMVWPPQFIVINDVSNALDVETEEQLELEDRSFVKTSYIY